MCAVVAITNSNSGKTNTLWPFQPRAKNPLSIEADRRRFTRWEVLEGAFRAIPSVRNTAPPEHGKRAGKNSQPHGWTVFHDGSPRVIRSPRRRGRGAWAGS
jgi:hypothetical protein